VAACGGAAGHSAAGARGLFPVAISAADFPRSQHLAQQTHLVIAVRNAGAATIPDVAVTICNVTCAHPAPRGEGTSAQAFSQDIAPQPQLADASRPLWIIDRAPGPCAGGCATGGAGGAVTASANTWALGQLTPGQTARFDWAVTAVAAGRHVVAWQVAAGLDGGAVAVLSNGAAPRGTFTVDVLSAPAQTYVTSDGSVVTRTAP
jgi:hypothetical protein